MIVLNPSRPQLIAIAAILIVVAAIAALSAATRPVRESVRTYTQLLGAASDSQLNRFQTGLSLMNEVGLFETA